MYTIVFASEAVVDGHVFRLQELWVFTIIDHWTWMVINHWYSVNLQRDSCNIVWVVRTVC